MKKLLLFDIIRSVWHSEMFSVVYFAAGKDDPYDWEYIYSYSVTGF